MATGGRRGSAGERVLEGRHVIGLFLLMLLFSGVFFTLGYVMGRNQYASLARADSARELTADLSGRQRSATKTADSSSDNPGFSADTSTPPSSDWEFYRAGDKKMPDERLQTAHPASAVPVKSSAVKRLMTRSAVAQSIEKAPSSVHGSYSLQVAALTREADAMVLATNLQKKKFPAFVLSPKSDKYYRVQVGPYADQKSAEAAKKGLASAGFKAIVKH